MEGETLVMKAQMKESIFKLIDRIEQKYPVQGIPVLLYHRVGTPEDCKRPVSCITVEEFGEQIRYLSKSGYYFASISEIVDYVEGKRVLPSKSVALTFDDGYANNYIYAFPVLKKYGAKATIFVNTCFIGREVALKVALNTFLEVPEQSADVVYRFLSWNEIEEMHKGGIDFQPHGHTHPDLSKLEKNLVREEIIKSKEMLEKTLGKEGEFISYPFGRYSKRVISILKEQGFKAGVAVRPGIAKPGMDLYALPRMGIAAGCSLGRFKAMLSDYMRWYMYLSRIKRQVTKQTCIKCTVGSVQYEKETAKGAAAAEGKLPRWR